MHRLDIFTRPIGWSSCDKVMETEHHFKRVQPYLGPSWFRATPVSATFVLDLEHPDVDVRGSTFLGNLQIYCAYHAQQQEHVDGDELINLICDFTGFPGYLNVRIQEIYSHGRPRRISATRLLSNNQADYLYMDSWFWSKLLPLLALHLLFATRQRP